MEAPLIQHLPDRYEKNLKIWDQPFERDLRKEWEFCKTGKKERLNLRHTTYGFTIHSDQNIDVEVRRWLTLTLLKNPEWLVVYGIGLGYYYYGLKEWLQGSKSRRVIFFEDDPGVLQAFLETDAATDFLSDPQTELIYWKNRDFKAPELTKVETDSLYRSVEISALVSYEIKKTAALSQLRFIINYVRDVETAQSNEYLFKGYAQFQNFYHNILHLDKVLDGTVFKNAYSGMPAIVCGAGPSLAKQIPLLKSLKDRAIIFAGGTAMNGLNAYNLEAHFGCGVDPFPTQVMRILANKAFETPYFMRNRIHKNIPNVLHGPILYLPGATGYPISDWMDEKLGFSLLPLEEGANVIHLCASIARLLGCNPIIFVGVDLAYTDGLSYPPGLTALSMHDQKLITKAPSEEVVAVNDIYGKPVYTLFKWILESAWYNVFQTLHPDVKMINCTEGGIGLEGIAARPLKEVADQLLTQVYDLTGHTFRQLGLSMQKSPPTSVKIVEVIETWVQLLSSCLDQVADIAKNDPDIWNAKNPEQSPRLKEIEDALFATDVYTYLLKNFDTTFMKYVGTKERLSPSKMHQLLPGRFPYLQSIIHEALTIIKSALAENILENIGQTEHYYPPIIPDFEEHPGATDVITSPYDEKTGSGKKTTYGSDNNIIHEIHYKNYKMHGPSTFFYPSQKIATISAYQDGNKEGTSFWYNEEGTLLFKGNFKNNEAHGIHLYFYPNGNLKSVLPYENGILNGEVILYFPGGSVFRKVTFKQGKKQGLDIVYFPTNKVMLQGEYEEDKAIGTGRMWHIHGSLAKEVSYGPTGEITHIKQWDTYGNPIEEAGPQLDYFDSIAKDSMSLSHSIHSLSKALNEIVKLFHESYNEADKLILQNELKTLADELTKFEKMQQEILKISGLESKTHEESIWKTPENEKMMRQIISMLTLPMQESMVRLHGKLRQIMNKIQKKP